ncbi:MAG: CvpA family protein [Parvibaculaceae bacterium]
MTLFDGIVIAVLIISGGLAFLRGFINEVLSILAWVIGAVAALTLSKYVTPMFREFLGQDWLATIAAALAVFMLAYFVATIFASRWSAKLLDIFEQAEMMDRTLGLVFGLLRGLLIVTVAYLFFAWLVPLPSEQPDWIRNAKTRPLVERSAAMLFSLTPIDGGTKPRSEREPLIYQDRQPTSQVPAAKPPAAAPNNSQGNSGADTGKTPSYNSSERKGLDRLFESTE